MAVQGIFGQLVSCHSQFIPFYISVCTWLVRILQALKNLSIKGGERHRQVEEKRSEGIAKTEIKVEDRKLNSLPIGSCHQSHPYECPQVLDIIKNMECTDRKK